MKLKEIRKKHHIYFLPYEMVKTAYLELRYKTVQRLQGYAVDPTMNGSWTWDSGYELGHTNVPGVVALPKSDFELDLEYGKVE